VPSGGHPASPGGNAPLGRTQRTKKALTSGLFLAIIARLVVFAFALISGVFMIGVLFSFAVWVLTGQHAAFPSMLDFLVWGFAVLRTDGLDPVLHGQAGESRTEEAVEICRSRSTGPVMPLRQQVPVWLGAGERAWSGFTREAPGRRRQILVESRDFWPLDPLQ